MNFDRLKSEIKLITFFSEEELASLSALFSEVNLKKNEFLLKEGQVCNFVAFVTKGTLIYYKLLDSGKELTTDFAFAGDWVCNNQSRLCKISSALSIKAIEESQLLVIRTEDLEDCYKRYPQTERLGRILMEQSFIKIAAQTVDLQTISASDRYNKMLRDYPDVFQKVPLHYIANYLGIAPKSLSRIRKNP